MRIRNIALFAVAAAMLQSSESLADNQCIVKTIGSPNPAPMVENGVLYLYCTEDSTGNAGSIFNANLHCWTTTDLYHWQDSGVILKEANVPWCAKNNAMWAPTVVKLPDGMLHLYFPETTTDGVHHMGHAKSARPTGPFIADATHITGAGMTAAIENNAIDPFCIVDTGPGSTGKVYLEWCITGSTPNRLYMGVLNATYDSVIGTPTQLTQTQFYPDGSHYVEGPWLIKQNNTWYHFDAVYYPGSAEQIAYSTAVSILGPYTFRAFLMGTNSNSVNNTIHNGVCRFKNQWVNFWHCGGNEIGGPISKNNGAKRVTSAEYFSFDTTATPWKIKGLGATRSDTIPKTMRGIGIPRAASDTIQVDRQSAMSGVSIAVATGIDSLGWMVSAITNNGWVRYDSVDFTPLAPDYALTAVSARVGSASIGGNIDLRLGSATGTLLATIPVPATGGLTTWATTPATMLAAVPPAGVQNLVCVFHTTAANQFVVNWVKFAQALSPSTLPAPALTAPTNGSPDRPLSISLSWATVSGAVSYQLQLATSAAFTSGSYWTGLTSLSRTVSALSPATTYFWRANTFDGTYYSSWSSVWTFTTQANVAAIPQSGTLVHADLEIRNGVIVYRVRKTGSVEVSLRDLRGRSTTLVNRIQPAGCYSVSPGGSHLATGRYLVRVKSAGVDARAWITPER